MLRGGDDVRRAEDAGHVVLGTPGKRRGQAPDIVCRRLEHLVPQILSPRGGTLLEACAILESCPGAGLLRRIDAGDGRDEVSRELAVLWLPVLEPGSLAFVARKRLVDMGVAVGVVLRHSVRLMTDAGAVGAALHADLVPEVAEGERTGTDLPDTERARIVRAGKRGRPDIDDVRWHDEGLVDRLCKACGITRKTPVIVERCDYLVKNARLYKTAQNLSAHPTPDTKKIFLWHYEGEEDGIPEHYRVPSEGDKPRDAQDITFQEAARCAIYVCKTQFGMPREDLIRQTSHALGFKNSGGWIGNLSEAAVNFAVSRGELSETPLKIV